MPPLQPQHQCDVLLVTVTDVETRSLLEVAKTQTNRDYTPLTGKHKTYFDLGEIGGVRVFAVRSEMATSTIGGSLVTVKDAIAEVKPSAVIMVGIAFGVNEEKQNIGDILVSKQLQPYELQRVGTTNRGKPKITLRGDKAHCSEMLLDRLRTTHLQWNKSAVEFGLVLSGEKLIDNVDFRNELLLLSEETIGGEMEGGGLYVACQPNKVDWILVKAICDWADGKKGEGKKENQKLAAMNAAEFVMAMLTAELLAKSTLKRLRFNRYRRVIGLATFIILVLIGGGGYWLWGKEERAMKSSPYAQLTNTELRLKTSILVTELRKLLSDHEEMRNQLDRVYYSKRSQISKNESQQKQSQESSILWNEWTNEGFRISQWLMSEYDNKHKTDAFLFRDELVLRVKPAKRDKYIDSTYQHPTNPLGMKAVIEDLEVLAKMLSE